MYDATELPAQFAAGETVSYRRTNPDFPADDGWTLTVGLRGASVANATVTEDGADYLVLLEAATTATLAAGQYKAVEVYTHATEGVKPFSVDVVVTPNIYAAGAGDLVSEAASKLALLNAKIEGRITADQEMISIDGISLKREDLALFEKMRDKYQAIVDAEISGGGSGMGIELVRFKRPA
jgi:hypothetical protein